MKTILLILLLSNAAHARTCFFINCMFSTGILHACFKWNSGTLEAAQKYIDAENTAPGLVSMIECVPEGKEPIVVKSDKQGMNLKGETK